ncbi:hypothetical protein GGI12_002773 [Dipsacomyces acuminosporus]|nr:hypothetical protein GGI12_002773 [Dipsacomyces acuminosporus]
MLYATLANRDYFMTLASAGQSQAELHESRAEIAESLAILCVKSLHKLGSKALQDALCVKYTPMDMDGLRLDIANSMAAQSQEQIRQGSLVGTIVVGDDGERHLPNPVRGERHMSLLSDEQRVCLYRLGRAGELGGRGVEDEDLGSSPQVWQSRDGWSTPIEELAQGYLLSGSRIVAERAIEVAIRSEAKRFTAQKLVGEVVRLLWDGTLHWKGYKCACLPAPSRSNTPPEIEMQATNTTITEAVPLELMLTFARRMSSSSDLATGHLCMDGRSPSASSLLAEPNNDSNARLADYSAGPRQLALEKWMAQTLEPLRIPMFENILTMIHTFFFLALYTVVSLRREREVLVEEVTLHICVIAYVADEIRQFMESGFVVYFKSVWNVLDVSIYAVFTAFLALRIRCLYTGSQADLDKAYDVLSINATMLWPRVFAVLDQYEFFGTIIIQVRRIISGTSLFFALLIVMSAGFFQTFYSLSLRHNKLLAGDVWGLMVRIFFGSSYLGWDSAVLFGPYVGLFVMSMYIGVSMLILYNILIGVINQCMVEINENSAQEFRFAYTMRVSEYVSAKQTYPCIPPLNLIQIFVFWPLRNTTFVPQKYFALLRSAILLLAYAPHLLLHRIYKQVGRWWRAKSGMHRKALRAECFLAERELALIKIGKSDIDEFAFAGGADDCVGNDRGTKSNGNSAGKKSCNNGGEMYDSIPIGSAPSASQTNMHASQQLSTAAEPTPKALDKSSTLTIGRNGGSSRWTNLLGTWRARQQAQPVQNPNWAPFAHAASAASASSVNTSQLADIERRMEELDTRMASIDKRLATITRLLKPVTNDD